jgi:hypothetical protein
MTNFRGAQDGIDSEDLRDAGPEPGEFIADVTCPHCGAELRVEHGDDEGEIGVITR